MSSSSSSLASSEPYLSDSASNKNKQCCTVQKIQNKNLNESDESVIFAEDSDKETLSKKSNYIPNLDKLNDPETLNKKHSNQRKNNTNSVNAIDRQYIYIQMVSYVRYLKL
jgi:hypothetical protein